MKIRYFFIGYTAAMLLLFFCMIATFEGSSFSSRDMVYYNEQRILIEEAMEHGQELPSIEQRYGCEILLLQDSRYEMDLQEALKSEALILDYRKKDTLKGKIVWKDKAYHYQRLEKSLHSQVIWIWGSVLAGGYLLLGFLYIRLVRPFQKLETFTKQVAKGNLMFPLPIEKKDYFGAYTESFDLMREELKQARENEYRANQSKKELIAELSHDIKTPVATIMAACEVMQVKEKNPDTQEKLTVISSKAKVIHELVNNLFHATLEELTVLKVEPLEESSRCLQDMLQEAHYYGKMILAGDIPECLIYVDALRLQQVLDNCLNNAWKYAGTAIEVTFREEEAGIWIKIKDEGKGVPEEELPFLAEKFYRGSNAKGKDGSGLGLHLSKVFMQKMQGDIEYYNEDGFVVQIYIRKVHARSL